MFRNHEKSPEKPNKKRKTPDKSSTIHILDVFKQGDLIFGLNNEHRGKIDDALEEKNYDYYYANQLNTPAVGLVVANSKQIQNLNSNQKKHYHFLMSLRSYLIRPQGKPVPSMQDQPVKGSAYRRACKAIVRNANQDQSVHFELTGLDIARVCKKEKDDLGVTNSELRAAYRQAMKEGENPHLFFYLDGKSCPPPWKQPKFQEYWLGYEKLREAKKSHKYSEATAPEEKSPHKKLKLA